MKKKKQNRIQHARIEEVRKECSRRIWVINKSELNAKK